jgi:hypothetical protein
VLADLLQNNTNNIRGKALLADAEVAQLRGVKDAQAQNHQTCSRVLFSGITILREPHV